MAPFRSSRSTRNNDPATLNRGRGGVIDHDPTEGLPVRNWYLGNINIKQDEPVANDDEQQANANTTNPDYPWPEIRLPSFYSELPPLSQQIVRVSRSGRPIKPSVYDKKTGTYISHAEYAARNRLKSKHLENVDSPAADDDDDMAEELDVKAEMEKQERAFAMRKWAQMPSAVADRRPEPKYLADRRAGMRNLYGFQAAALNPALNLAAAGSAATGLDLGDGSGLGNAPGVLAAGDSRPPTAVTPVKRMPPKRKKKGGPGRKKANLGAGLPSSAGTEGLSSEGVKADRHAGQAADGSAFKAEGDTPMEDAHDGDDQHEDDGSGSEEEGSEEGEIEENQIHDIEMKHEEAVPEPEPAVDAFQQSLEPAVPTDSVGEANEAGDLLADEPPPALEIVEPAPPAVEAIEPEPLPPAASTLEEVALVPEALPEEARPEAVEPVDPIDPIDPVAPVAPVAPVELVELVEPVEPIEPVESVEPAEPAKPAGNVDFLGSLDGAVADMEQKED